MLKLKTRKSAQKRYKKTGQGKFIRKTAFKSHLLGKKSAKRKRRLCNRMILNKSEIFAVKKMLPY